MKKIISIVCFAAALLTVGCHKDKDNKPQNNGGGSQQQTAAEGAFNPGAKIATIAYADDPAEMWNWDGNLLRSISEADGNGGSTEKSSFTYRSDNRLERMTTELAGMPAEVAYSYGGGKLTAISAVSGDRELLSVVVDHNSAGKISRMSFEVDTLMLNYLISMLGELPDLGFDLSDLGGLVDDRMPSKGHGTKFHMDHVGFTLDFVWNGSTVSHAYLDASVTATTSREEIETIIDPSVLGEYADYIDMIPATMPIPLTIAYKDTADYTYDGHSNPLYGFFGKLDMAVLSNANIATQHRHGVLSLSATVSIPFLGEQTIPLYDYPVDSGIESFSYTYRPSGYPERVNDANQTLVKQYSYLNE